MRSAVCDTTRGKNSSRIAHLLGAPRKEHPRAPNDLLAALLHVAVVLQCALAWNPTTGARHGNRGWRRTVLRSIRSSHAMVRNRTAPLVEHPQDIFRRSL